VSQCSAGPHKPGLPGATPGPATYGRVRKQAKRRDQTFRSVPESLVIQWVRRPPRLLARSHRKTTQPAAMASGRTARKAMVQLHPGSFDQLVCRCFRPHASSVRRKAGFNSRTDLLQVNNTGCWSNGTTPGLQPGNRGSTPRRSTEKRTGSWSKGKTSGWQSEGPPLGCGARFDSR
jgi:hypothetical protein